MLKIKEIMGHCDIPCAVYDPSQAQYSTLSVIRFLDIINEINDDIISFRGQSVALHEQFLSIETLDYFIELDLQPRVEHKERIERAWRFFNGSIVHNVMLTKVQIAIHKFVLDNPQYNAINYFDKMQINDQGIIIKKKKYREISI